MNLESRFLRMAAFLAAGAVLCSCAARQPVPLPEQVREAQDLAVGVAFGRTCPPEMRIEGLPARGLGPPGPGPDIFRMRDRDRGYGGGGHPIVLADKRKLEGYLRARDAGVYREIQDRLVRELKSRGWNAVALEARFDAEGLPRFDGSGSGYAERDYRGVAPGEGLDALMVIDCRWFGVHCQYIDIYHQYYTDTEARFVGQMIDLGTNRVLWRSMEAGARNPAPCRCNDPEDFSCIDASLRAAAYEAASALVIDLFGGGT